MSFINCSMFDIEKCAMCIREDTSLTGSCSIKYFKDRLIYQNDIKKYIFDVVSYRRMTLDPPKYLQKAIEQYFPQYIKLYNTITLLY